MKTKRTKSDAAATFPLLHVEPDAVRLGERFRDAGWHAGKLQTMAAIAGMSVCAAPLADEAD